MAFNWDACKEIAPDKYVVWVIKHNTKPSVYNDVSYPTKESAQDIIDFDNVKNAHPESMIVMRYRDKKSARSSGGDFDEE